MSEASQLRSDEFLRTSGQFKLGALVTEAAHPVTAHLSEVAKRDLPAALGLLFQADGDVLQTFREWATSGRLEAIAATLRTAVQGGGRIFFTGCGSTGRLSILLDAVWRDFWRQQKTQSPAGTGPDYENRTVSVMAGGDYALIRAVEGFEDYMKFGSKQLADAGVSEKDVVFAITEGGETSFVIGTVWAGVKAGAKVYFVCNNPPELLATLERSQEVMADGRVEKIHLVTGPMSITGSTRMQATSIQLAVLVTILEMVTRELVGEPSADVPRLVLAGLEELLSHLAAPASLAALARLVELEEAVYRARGRASYFADRFSIDVLTDMTERPPTFGIPPFRKFDDDKAAESWAFLHVPHDWTDQAWENLLKRSPQCLKWTDSEIHSLVPPDQYEHLQGIVDKIGPNELMRYKIGSNGIKYRPLVLKDGALAVLAAREATASVKFQLKVLATARANHARTGLLYFGQELPGELFAAADTVVSIRVPATRLLLDGLTRVAVKLVLNALSTSTMTRMGRVMGNTMTSVVPSNLKLIDRATRCITQLTGLEYELANALLFEVMEYIEPRLKADQPYPSVVSLAVVRAKNGLSNESAEKYLSIHGFTINPVGAA